MLRRHKFLTLILAISLVRGLIYSAVIPPWQAPDEPRHFEYVKLLYQKGRLVNWGDVTPSVEQEIIASMDRYSFWQFGAVHADVFPSNGLPRSFREIWLPGLSHELHQPPLAYVIYAIVLSFVGANPAVQLYAMRLVSVLTGALVVLAAYATMTELFPDNSFMRLGAPGFIAFLPMHTYTNSVLTNDNLAALFVSLIILLQVISLRRGFTVFRLLLSALLLGLAIFTKRTAIVGAPIILLAIVTFLIRQDVRSRLPWKKLAIFSGSLTLLAGVVMLNWERLESLLVSLIPGFDRALPSLLYVYVFYFLRPSSAHSYSIEPVKYVSLDALPYYRRFFLMLFETFWARFGWVNVSLSPLWYLLLGLVCLASVIGLTVFTVRIRKTLRRISRVQKESLLLFLIAVLFNLGMLLARMIRDWDNVPRPLTQGKFLFSVVIPIATLFILGLRELVPPSYRRQLLLGWLGSLVLLDGISLLVYIVPFYYG